MFSAPLCLIPAHGMSLNNVIQFPKSSASRRRVPIIQRLRRARALLANIGLTLIALAALGVLGTIGWVYGVCLNKTLSGMPRTESLDAAQEQTVVHGVRDQS